MDPGDADRMGFFFPDPGRGEHLYPGQAVGCAPVGELLKTGDLLRAGGDDQLAADLIGDAVGLAEADQLPVALDAVLRFQAVWCVIDTGVDYAAVVARLVPGNAGFLLKNEDTQGRVSISKF